MILVVCLDDGNGMGFNRRRQSQDRLLRADRKHRKCKNYQSISEQR